MRWVVVWVSSIVVGVPLLGLLSIVGIGQSSEGFIQQTLFFLFHANYSQGLLVAHVSRLLVACIPGFCTGVSIGGIQWYLLARDQPFYPWIGFTVLGSTLGWWLASTLFPWIAGWFFTFLHRGLFLQFGTYESSIVACITGYSVGYMGGVVVGTMQWLILRHTLPYAGWWIPASATGWALFWALGGLFALVMLHPQVLIV